MDPMQIRRIWVLSGVLVALTFALWVEPAARRDAAVEIGPPVDDATRVAIQWADGTARVIERQAEGRWRAGGFALDDADVREVLDAIASLRWAEAVELSPHAMPEDFGLGEPPWARIAVTRAGDVQTLDLGTPTEVGLSSYVRGADGVIRVARARPHGILAAPRKRPSHRATTLDPAEIVRVDLKEPKGSWSLVRVEPLWIVDDALRGESATIERWLDEVTSRPAAPAVARATLHGGRDREVVGLGDRAPDPSRFVAATLLGLDRQAADTVEVRLGEVQWTGRRNGSAWVSPLGEGPSWDVVTALTTLRQAPSRAHPPRPTSPWGEVTVTAGDDRWTVTFAAATNGTHLVWLPGASRPAETLAASVDRVVTEIHRQ